MGNYCKIDVAGNLLHIEAACNLECFFEDYIMINNEVMIIDETTNASDNEIMTNNDDCVYICSTQLTFNLPERKSVTILSKIPFEMLLSLQKK